MSWNEVKRLADAGQAANVTKAPKITRSRSVQWGKKVGYRDAAYKKILFLCTSAYTYVPSVWKKYVMDVKMMKGS